VRSTTASTICMYGSMEGMIFIGKYFIIIWFWVQAGK
jgi:hypothetical protein